MSSILLSRWRNRVRWLEKWSTLIKLIEKNPNPTALDIRYMKKWSMEFVNVKFLEYTASYDSIKLNHSVSFIILSSPKYSILHSSGFIKWQAVWKSLLFYHCWKFKVTCNNATLDMKWWWLTIKHRCHLR